jgi:hypothetical protein
MDRLRVCSRRPLLAMDGSGVLGDRLAEFFGPMNL